MADEQPGEIEPVYLTVDDVLGLHGLIIGATSAEAADHLRNRDGLESALARPATYAHYENADLALQATVLAHGIAEGQLFIDGNKRTANASTMSCPSCRSTRAGRSRPGRSVRPLAAQLLEVAGRIDAGEPAVMALDRATTTFTGSSLLGSDCVLAGLHQPQQQPARRWASSGQRCAASSSAALSSSVSVSVCRGRVVGIIQM
jgi:hypothetical protein